MICGPSGPNITSTPSGHSCRIDAGIGGDTTVEPHFMITSVKTATRHFVIHSLCFYTYLFQICQTHALSVNKTRTVNVLVTSRWLKFNMRSWWPKVNELESSCWSLMLKHKEITYRRGRVDLPWRSCITHAGGTGTQEVLWDGTRWRLSLFSFAVCCLWVTRRFDMADG